MEGVSYGQSSIPDRDALAGFLEVGSKRGLIRSELSTTMRQGPETRERTLRARTAMSLREVRERHPR